jgi:D-alanyl-D-alanine carboxypeptidase/D-alanyl-D-alanine-endopeptidase (penicillin-binding protein 4)
VKRGLLWPVVSFALLGASPVPIVAPVAGSMPWSPSAVAKLDADLDAMLATSPALRGAHYGMLAVDTATGAVLYDHDSDGEFQPASTLKLLVGSAALEQLGPAFAFRTTVSTIGTSAANVRRILVSAGGDPTLATADFIAASRAVAALDAVPTDVTIGAGRYDALPYPNGWTWDDFAQSYAPKVSAMTLDENVVSYRVAPGSAPGARAVVYFNDPERPLAAPDRCHAENVSLAVTGPANSEDTIDVERGNDGCIDVTGSIPLGAPEETVDAAVDDPVLTAQTTFSNALAAAGVKVVPPLPNEALEVGERVVTVVWIHDSKALETLLGPRFWIPSDNLFGELLLKEVGYSSGVRPGSTAGGIAFEKRWLRGIGVDPATVTLADGCGMSQYDRITPRDLVAILQHDWNGTSRQLILDSLPVGGARGTIEGIAGTAAAGRVFAKTGSMMHVRGLAGFLTPLAHGAVTFAFNVDDWNGDYPSLAALRAKALSRIVTDGS